MTYEFTFLLNEESELKNIKKLLAEFSGNVLEENDWGNKNLAYPIKKVDVAHFYNWTIEIGEKNVSDYKKKLNFNEKLLRYLLLKVD